MTGRVAKIVGVMLFLLFIGGTVLLPAFHRAHCSDNHATHETANCSICQFANTPSITSFLDIAPIAGSIVSDNVALHISPFLVPSLRDPTQARAPPVT